MQIFQLTLKNFFDEGGKKFNDADKQLIERAFNFAKKAHGGQKRKSSEPYFVHSFYAGLSLLKWGLDAETIAAGLLHDVAEDTDVYDCCFVFVPEDDCVLGEHIRPTVLWPEVLTINNTDSYVVDLPGFQVFDTTVLDCRGVSGGGSAVAG